MPAPAARRILVCPDSFKGTFAAAEVAANLAAGIREAGGVPVELPLGDGGEGTMDAVHAGLGGERRAVRATGPLGAAVEALYLALPDGTCVVEAAQASGLGLVPEGDRDAWRASTRGTGELIAAAADAGADRILVAVGGSATTDGGRGALEALESVQALPPLTVLCDVATEFERAAEVFAPQKGADPETVARLTERLHRVAGSLPRDPRGLPRTGAAGGLSGALWAAHGAELVSGAEFVLDLSRFDRRAAGCDLLVTGEGCLDHQTAHGKVVSAVAARAARLGIPCAAVVGRSQLGRDEAEALGLRRVLVASSAAEQVAAGRELAATA